LTNFKNPDRPAFLWTIAATMKLETGPIIARLLKLKSENPCRTCQTNYMQALKSENCSEEKEAILVPGDVTNVKFEDIFCETN
jgi:hypothetical protein